MDIMKLLGLDPHKDLELVSTLCKSNGTHHDLLQTVLDKKADFAPLEFGMTRGRREDLGENFVF